MKKIALLLAIVLVVAAPLTAQAATPRAATIMPDITFTGTTANCSALIFGDASTDRIEATIKLRTVSACVETWNVSGTGYIDWHDTATVVSGTYYMLTVDVTVNGKSIGQDFVDGVCN